MQGDGKRVRTLGLERVFCSKFCGRHGRGRYAASTLACTRAQATHLLILVDFTFDPFLIAFFGTFIGSHSSQQPPEAAFNNRVIHLVLASVQRRVEHILLFGRKRTLDIYFESPEEKGSENVVQLVN
jgi:hypothetical protein